MANFLIFLQAKLARLDPQATLNYMYIYIYKHKPREMNILFVNHPSNPLLLRSLRHGHTNTIIVKLLELSRYGVFKQMW